MVKNLFTKYYVFKEKIKDFFSPIFDPEKKEKGLALTISGTYLLVGAVVALGGVLWGAHKVGQTVSGAQADFKTSLVLGLGYFLMSIGQAAFWLASKSLVYVLSSDFVKRTITNDPTFSLVWGRVRDLADMIVVLGFVIVGIATALRIQEYAAKKILGRIIVVALLINFSGLFCGVIIDASNITMNGLLGNEKTSQNVDSLSNAINIYVENSLNSTGNNPDSVKVANENIVNDPGKFLFACAMFMVILLYAAYTFAIMAILFAARYAILAVLYILSPIAFAFWMFPSSRLKKYQSEWWDNFLKWSFVGVFGSFFIYLATQTIVAGNTTGDVNIFLLFVSFIFLIVGYKMIRKTGGIADIAAGAVRGAVTGGVGFAMGAAAAGSSAALKTADKWTGNKVSNAVQASKDRLGGFSEVMGWKQEGSTAAAKSQRVDKAAKDISTQYSAAKASGDINTVDRIQKEAMIGRGLRGGAAIKAVSDNNDLTDAAKKFGGVKIADMTNVTENEQAQINQRMMGRIKFGEVLGATGVRSQEEKKDPNKRADNDYLVNEKLRGKFNVGIKNATSTQLNTAKEEVTKDGYERASVQDIRDYSIPTLKSGNFAKYTPVKKMTKAMEMTSGAKADAISTSKDTLMNEMNKLKTKYPRLLDPSDAGVGTPMEAIEEYNKLDEKRNEMIAAGL